MADNNDDDIKRKIFFDKNFTQESVSKATQQIIKINDFDHKKKIQYELEGNVYNPKPIEIFIDSYGGSVYPCLGLLSIIKTSKTPVHTIAVGYAMSCGYMLLLSGHKRFAYEYATIMYHQISSFAWGGLKEMEESIAEGKRLQKILDQMTLEKTNITKKKIKEIYKTKKDFYMNAEKALRLGVVEEIIK